MFAYDLGGYQTLQLQDQLPKWATVGRYDIQARAGGNPTREQMQLMMQSLLADRFKLAVHTETNEGPIYALVLATPGKLGPYLKPDTEPCPANLATVSATAADFKPRGAQCGGKEIDAGDRAVPGAALHTKSS